MSAADVRGIRTCNCFHGFWGLHGHQTGSFLCFIRLCIVHWLFWHRCVTLDRTVQLLPTVYCCCVTAGLISSTISHAHLSANMGPDVHCCVEVSMATCNAWLCLSNHCLGCSFVHGWADDCLSAVGPHHRYRQARLCLLLMLHCCDASLWWCLVAAPPLLSPAQDEQAAAIGSMRCKLELGLSERKGWCLNAAVPGTTTVKVCPGITGTDSGALDIARGVHACSENMPDMAHCLSARTMPRQQRGSACLGGLVHLAEPTVGVCARQWVAPRLK